MEMGRVGDPFLEASIQFVIDGDRIWRIRFALQRGNYTAIDPVMDDREADAISLADLTNVQGSFGGCGAAMRCLYRNHFIVLGVIGLPVVVLLWPSLRSSATISSS